MSRSATMSAAAARRRSAWPLAAAAVALAAAVLAACTASSPPSTTAVHELAGQGVEEPVPEGEPVIVEGVVTARYLGEEGLDGFFIQDPEPAPDGEPSGVFVYAPELTAQQRERIAVGRRLRLEGRAGEHRGRRQLEWVAAVEDLGEAEAVRTAELPWPVADAERYEGVHVRLTTPLVVTANDTLARYGTLQLTPQRRAYRPTNFPPGEGPEDPALADQRLLLDDGSYAGRPDPVPYRDADGTRRVGTGVAEPEGILTHAFDAWRLHPTEPPRFIDRNPRPGPLPEPEAGTLRIAAFNVENYFLTLGERGAATEAELERQRAKLLAAAQRLSADILVLVEVENDDRAPADLVERLADASGEPWRRAAGGDAGDDAIRVSLAYRADRVEPVTEVVRDARSVHHRPPPVAGFRPASGGPALAVAGIHFKSKRDCPEAGDVDRGQGCWNERRTEQAEALAGFIDDWRAGQERALPALIAGDLNAYGAEDPARALAEAGKVDLLAEHLPWPERYTYVFQGESGYLDHLHAPPQLADRVAAVHAYPINADEPRWLEFDAAREALTAEDAFRSSDHDPVVVDLRLDGS